MGKGVRSGLDCNGVERAGVLAWPPHFPNSNPWTTGVPGTFLISGRPRNGKPTGFEAAPVTRGNHSVAEKLYQTTRAHTPMLLPGGPPFTPSPLARSVWEYLHLSPTNPFLVGWSGVKGNLVP